MQSANTIKEASKGARLIKAPGEGDCFFHVIAYFLGGSIFSREHAKKIRSAIAAYLAKKLFKPPYDNLEKLTELVLGARSIAELENSLKDLKKNDSTANELSLLRPTDEGNVARNGYRCPLAAWVVWYQFDAEEIESKKFLEGVCEELIQHDFLKYTIWGDLGLAAHVVQILTKRPVVIYLNKVEQEEHEKPINIFVTPGHFDAIVFFDDEEVEQWKEKIQSNKSIKPKTDSIISVASCPYAFGKLISDSSRITISSEYVKQFMVKLKTVARNQKYASPSLLFTKSLPVCYDLCEFILTQRKLFMGCRAKLHCDDIKFNNFPNAPIYVISSNRSRWLFENFASTFSGKIVRNNKKNKNRPVILVVGADEYKKYVDMVRGLNWGDDIGLYVLGCEGGFGIGWNRHCALKHAKRQNLKRVWMLDDDVNWVKDGSQIIDDLDDSMMDSTWIYSLWPGGIMQRGLGCNLEMMQNNGVGHLNFCPFFAFSKEDLSLQLVLNNVYESYCFGEKVCSLEKHDTTPDSAETLPERIKPMDMIAALPLWEESETRQPVDFLSLGLSSYFIMRLQEQAMYDCLENCPNILKLLVEEGWFSDQISD